MLWLFLNLLLTITICHSERNGEFIQTQSGHLHFTLGPIRSVARNDNPFEAKPPVVEWLTERDHDFGQLRHERPATFIFQFKNLDAQPILLQTVRTSCGCTAAKWTETPIAPGGTGEVEVEYDAYQRGEFSKKIRVFFDRQRKPEVLRIRGEVN